MSQPAQQEAAAASVAQSAGGVAEEEPNPCPICAYIEAGPCKQEHQGWVKCREDAKKAGKDYVDECQDTFKSFLACTLKYDYYEPLHEMLSLNQEGGEAAAAEDRS